MHSKPHSSSSPLATLYPLLFVALWSTGFIGAKFGLPDAEPLTFLSLRYAIVLVLMGALAWAMRAPWPRTAREWLHIGVSGVLVHGAATAQAPAAEAVLKSGRYVRSSPVDDRVNQGHAHWVAGDVDGNGLVGYMRQQDDAEIRQRMIAERTIELNEPLMYQDAVNARAATDARNLERIS